MKKIILKFITFFLSLVIVTGGIFWSGKTFESIFENNFYKLDRNPGYIPTGKQIKPVILGFDNFVADLFWLKAVQYTGGNASRASFYALPKYLNLITDLDPKFEFVYRFGALIFALREDIRNEIEPILLKGIKNTGNPILWTDLGFYKYYYEENFEEAAEIFDHCAKNIPDCPKFSAGISASLRAYVGKYQIALQTWIEKAKLIDEDSSDTEIKIIKNKIEEVSKLILINCAAKNFLKTDFKELDLNNLIGQDVFPCDDLEVFNRNIFKEFVDKNFKISKLTLTHPLGHNEFIWDQEKKIVRSKFAIKTNEE